MAKIEIEAGYIRGLETKARGLLPRIKKRIQHEDVESADKILYGEVMHLLGYISVLNEHNNESK